eukprot:scaffold96162_cov28-Tisochrysis_lutea.AAC.1
MALRPLADSKGEEEEVVREVEGRGGGVNAHTRVHAHNTRQMLRGMHTIGQAFITKDVEQHTYGLFNTGCMPDMGFEIRHWLALGMQTSNTYREGRRGGSLQASEHQMETFTPKSQKGRSGGSLQASGQ